MTTTHQPENWRVRFDEEFLDNGNWAVEWNEEEPHQITPSQVKSFIASEIEKSRQEALGELAPWIDGNVGMSSN